MNAFDIVRSSFIASLLVSVACGGTEPAPSAPAIEPCNSDCIEIGTGEESFQALTANQAIDVVAGIQGGYHLSASLRVKGVFPGDPEAFRDDNPTVDFDVFIAGTRIDVSGALPMGLADTGDGRFERVGRRVVLDNDVVEPYDAFDGTPVTLVITVTDSFGNRHSTSVDLVTRCVR